MTQSQPFERLVEVYESLVDWPRRLAREGPFFRRVFESAEVQRVIDFACGTGHHAALFAGWGLFVLGTDSSKEMIQRARQTHGQTASLRWTVRSFDQPDSTEPPFDAAICVGNSLALAKDWSTAGNAVRCMVESIRPGGVLIIHLLNLWRLPDGPCQWQKCCRVAVPDRVERLLVTKGVHRSGERGFVDLLISDPNKATLLKSESVPLLGIEKAQLEQSVRQAGADDVEFYGGYQEETYQREQSTDLIMVARKPVPKISHFA